MKVVNILAAALATAALTACTVSKADPPPPLSGPSGFALSVTMVAIPDSISQDGGSQSAIRVTAIGPNGRPLASVPFRMDIRVNGVAQDYGSLSARTVVTNSDGLATLVYTAPPSPPDGLFGTCFGLPGTCIDIVATSTGSDFNAANPQSVAIRLVPTGVILPPASTPSPCFTVSPTPPAANVALQFTAGTLVGTTCQAPSSDITSFQWLFGDGTSGSGRTVSHVFTTANTFNVTLTETNDRGISGSVTQAVQIGGGALPTPQFTFSPASPGVNETIFFNASTSTAGAGHTIVSYRWTFGDGGTASGVNVSHAYATAGTYSVQLTVTDEAGQSVTSAATQITPGNPPGPTANFTYSPQSPSVGDNVVFDYRTSTTSAGQRIVSLDWNFGDGTEIVHCPGHAACTSDGITTHTYTRTGAFVVNLVVTDSAGRTNATQQQITVGSGNPIPSFTVSPASPTVGQSTTFDANGTQTSGGATIQSYAWNFGDPSPANNTSTNGPVTTHQYSAGAAGSRTITLTVVDSLGRRGTTSVTVTVQ